MCAIAKAPVVAIKCWGRNSNYQLQGPRDDDPPRGLKLLKENTCNTEHPAKSGATACTSCVDSRSSPDGDCVNNEQCHFTILDPKTNTGTCTTTPW